MVSIFLVREIARSLNVFLIATCDDLIYVCIYIYVYIIYIYTCIYIYRVIYILFTHVFMFVCVHVNYHGCGKKCDFFTGKLSIAMVHSYHNHVSLPAGPCTPAL